MQAYLRSAFMQDHKSALQYYGSALSVLEWGRKTWENVPATERGAIFQPTFATAIRRFYIESYQAVYVPAAPSSSFLYLQSGMQACKEHCPSTDYSLDELDRLSKTLIDELDNYKPTGREAWFGDHGFFAAFFLYPMAEAYA